MSRVCYQMFHAMLEPIEILWQCAIRSCDDAMTSCDETITSWDTLGGKPLSGKSGPFSNTILCTDTAYHFSKVQYRHCYVFVWKGVG